jgi:hypothetical protein
MSSSGKDRAEEPSSGESSMSTPLLLRRNQNSDQKYAQETNAMAIEEDKPKPDQARHARDGINKLLTDMETLQRRNQAQVSSETIAETQMLARAFGAILLTRKRDGSIVIQSARKLKKMTVKTRMSKSAQARDVLATVDTKSRQEPDIPV